MIFPLICFFAYGFAIAGHNGIIISPTRVVFEGRVRSAVVNIVNPDQKAVTYRISLVSIRMDRYGKTYEEPSVVFEENLAKQMIRYAPRQITLAGGKKQAIRLIVRKPDNIAAGEYRTHLKIVPILNINNKLTANLKEMERSTQMQVDLLVGITIPVIVRHGDVNVKVVPCSCELKTEEKTLKRFFEIEMKRFGNRSAIVDVIVYYLENNKSKEIKAGHLRGIAIYTSNKSRIVRLPVSTKIIPSNCRIRVVVKDRENKKQPMLGLGDFSI